MEEELSPEFSIDASFDKDRHIRFLDMMIDFLPSEYQPQEINHLTLAYFILSSLDILGALDRVDEEAVACWVLSFQVHPKHQDELSNGEFYGFLGSRSLQFPADINENLGRNSSHLASTYCALAILKIIGHDLSLIGSASIVRSMRNLQQHDGRAAEIRVHGVDEQLPDKDQHVGDVLMMNKAQGGHVRSGNGHREMSDKLKIKWKKVKEFINQMSPKGLRQLIENLNDKQKEGIREIDGKLLVRNFDMWSCSLPLANGRMRLTEYDVHVMLGLPTSPLEIVEPENEINATIEFRSLINRWKQQLT
ncbi:hypothetical protein Cgig2_034095 [Carnegiea gigantea]|uniref:Prenyltransferase alpha-alpha toroid domain-containing protein n=1 Tax=Carnegiea gigantea TaxID=171969 RepID=A0A9Q1GZK7_9CARY|nr:hypothetical protein Cgig2_034095 [Carnegiea gigantea]